jgi:manganese transport protein
VSSAVITPLGVSYVLAGLFGWKMDKTDKIFLATNIIVVVFGILVATTGIQPITLIIMAQAINAIFLPLIVFVLIYITSRSNIMNKYKNTKVQNLLGIGVLTVALIIGISSIMSLL